MDWKLYDINGELIKYVNCQYDACDIATWDYNAEKLELDFINKFAKIIKIKEN